MIIVATLLELLLPRNDFRPFLNMVVGLVLMLTLLAPLRMMLNLPGDMDPAVFGAVGVSDADIAVREEMLAELNWEMALSRYRELVEARITAVLQEEKMSLAGLTLDINDDASHPEFGRPRQVSVLASSGGDGGDRVKPVAPVRIGEPYAESEETKGEEDHRLAMRLASELGMSVEKVSVRVLN